MAKLELEALDKFIVGESWIGSQIDRYRDVLCDEIGARWGGSEKDKETAEFIVSEMLLNGLNNPRVEPFQIKTWQHEASVVKVIETGRKIKSLPFLRCPAAKVEAPLIDIGHASNEELLKSALNIKGSAVLMSMTPEPFSPPQPITARLKSLDNFGASSVLVIENKTGGRLEYHSTGEWLERNVPDIEIPIIKVSNEDGLYLRRLSKKKVNICVDVKSTFFDSTAFNTVAEIKGDKWPEEHIILAGHHDTVIDSSGGNDNSSGTIAVIEVARVLSKLKSEMGFNPGMTLKFATWSGEEQKLQGSRAFVKTHYSEKSKGPLPRLNINLDELSTGHMKGIALQFPNLREFIQDHLDLMGDDLKCYVMSYMDAHSDHFAFSERAIDACITWRWRFYGRHGTAEFHHEPGDAADKLNVRELKEYVAQLSRLIIRLSKSDPKIWPHKMPTLNDVELMINRDIDQYHRTFH